MEITCLLMIFPVTICNVPLPCLLTTGLVERTVHFTLRRPQPVSTNNHLPGYLAWERFTHMPWASDFSFSWIPRRWKISATRAETGIWMSCGRNGEHNRTHGRCDCKYCIQNKTHSTKALKKLNISVLSCTSPESKWTCTARSMATNVLFYMRCWMGGFCCSSDQLGV